MRKNPPAKWVLPLVVNPPTSTEWCVPVPDDPFHRAAFLGALASLGSAYKWQDDPDHTAKDVAQVWRDIADNLERCMSEPETIFVDEWEDDLAICESLRWNDGVLEGFCCGEWVPIPGAGGGVVPGPVVQPPGQSRPAVGQSKCFNVALSANNRWQLPFPVLPGDIVTISNVSGTWSDGGLSPWYTPDGHTAIFGVSTGGGQGHAGGDPFATPYHMALVAFTPAEDFQAQTASPFTIGGSGSQQLTLQANDGTLDDNSGTIAFRICVQNGGTPPAGTWCYVFDFTASPYGFIPDNRDGYGGVWSTVYGLAADPALSANVSEWKCILPGTTIIHHVEFTWKSVLSSAVGSVGGIFLPVPTSVGDIAPLNTAGLVSNSVDGTWSTSVIQVGGQGYGTAPAFGLVSLLLEGEGDNPFGLDNC